MRRVVGLIMVLGAASMALEARADDDAIWPDLREALFGQRMIHEGTQVVALDAPYRAHDAAVVPITIRSLIPQTENRWIQRLHLIIDDNPAPVAGVFELDRALGDATIATRVRVNEYTNVRAVAETSDGELHMTTAFVKAAGGCSAPAMKDHEIAMGRLGKMKFKTMTPFEPGALNTAQVLISHPNYTGLQIDQLSRNWIPPDYINRIEISLDGRPLLKIEGDISLAEDPAITFNFLADQPGTMKVVVEDTEGRHFENEWTVGPAS